LQTPGTKPRRRQAPPVISARLGPWARIEAYGSGAIAAVLGTESIELGTYGAPALRCLQELRTGLPLSALASGNDGVGKEAELLVRRLANQGLLEFPAGRTQDGASALVVIEPQVRGYWPKMPELSDADTVALSRFAYMRCRSNEMVIESPLASALFRICDPKLAGFLAALAAPQQIKQLRRQDGFPGLELLALLVDCEILFKSGPPAGEANQRLAEGDQSLALWDFHDLLFHARSTEGRHANPLGGIYPHGGVIPPLPAVRPSWPGKKIDLCTVLDSNKEAAPRAAQLLRQRHSTRSFDDGRPVTLPELSQFLDGAARVLPRPASASASDDADLPDAARPYPSAGGSYELELYLAVNICDGLPQGFYHYDAAAHALSAIEVPAREVRTLLTEAASAMGVTDAPQILITIAARFGRVSWKYSSIAYSLILRDVGVLTQTLYLMAAGMGLGGCAIGIANIDQFAKMTGIGFHIEGPAGQFALGRPAVPAAG
jgi:SagB-type dehydrogenase family enzyme